MSCKFVTYLDGSVGVVPHWEPTGYVIPEHEKKLLVDDGMVLMLPPIRGSFPLLSKNNIPERDFIDCEETGLEGIKMLPHPVIVPWRYNLDHRETRKADSNSRYVHCCPREENIYPKRGNLVRRGNSSGDVFSYWCNSCGYATTEAETTTLDFLNI